MEWWEPKANAELALGYRGWEAGRDSPAQPWLHFFSNLQREQSSVQQ